MSCTPDAMGESPDCDAGISCATQACPAACTSGCPGNLGTSSIRTNRSVPGASQGGVCTPDASFEDPATCGTGVTCWDDVSDTIWRSAHVPRPGMR
jgi:hypothetical protein